MIITYQAKWLNSESVEIAITSVFNFLNSAKLSLKLKISVGQTKVLLRVALDKGETRDNGECLLYTLWRHTSPVGRTGERPICLCAIRTVWNKQRTRTLVGFQADGLEVTTGNDGGCFEFRSGLLNKGFRGYTVSIESIVKKLHMIILIVIVWRRR